MRGWLIGGVLALGLPLCAGQRATAARPEAQATVWQGDYEAARALARKTGRPMLVVFR